MKKMTAWGVGPRIMIPGYCILLVLSWLPVKLSISKILYIPRLYLTVVAIILIGIGIVILTTTDAEIKKALRTNMLITTGLFSRIRNPMYAAHFFFLMPGVCLLTNNAMVFLSVIFALILFLILVPGEEKDLEDNFGIEYLQYKSRTGRLLPKFSHKDCGS